MMKKISINGFAGIIKEVYNDGVMKVEWKSGLITFETKQSLRSLLKK
jgi:hypothetical protein